MCNSRSIPDDNFTTIAPDTTGALSSDRKPPHGSDVGLLVLVSRVLLTLSEDDKFMAALSDMPAGGVRNWRALFFLPSFQFSSESGFNLERRGAGRKGRNGISRTPPHGLSIWRRNHFNEPVDPLDFPQQRRGEFSAPEMEMEVGVHLLEVLLSLTAWSLTQGSGSVSVATPALAAVARNACPFLQGGMR